MKDIKVYIDDPTPIHCDNLNAINVSKNHVLHSKTKSISIKHCFLRDKVNEKEARLEYVATKEKITYIFMKPLPKCVFEYLIGMLGMTTILIRAS